VFRAALESQDPATIAQVREQLLLLLDGLRLA